MRRVNRSLRGRFVLDPRFPRPPHARMDLDKVRAEPLDYDVRLPAWEDDGTGAPTDPHMLLECKNGSIDADVWVVGAKKAEGDGAENAVAGLYILEKNGFVVVKLVRFFIYSTIV